MRTRAKHSADIAHLRYRAVARWRQAASLAIGLFPVLASAAMLPDLADLSLEQLSQIEITTVSKRPEALLDASASVFVITREDILRTGVTSVPEALRLAPGVEVARINAYSWAISIRGFNSDIANKLLVLIDGRSVYSPLYAGVFWDVQNLMLADIDRIEVVSGPGGTLWGANAVNGVINIITRSADQTQGGLAQVGAGSEERGFANIRYGMQLGNQTSLRAYAQFFDRDSSSLRGGGSAVDDWQMAQTGFRLDRQPGHTGQLTLQGDFYRGRHNTLASDDFTLGTLPEGIYKDALRVEGGNLLGRWNRGMGADGQLSLQVYYDYTQREIPSRYTERRNTLDIDLQHHFPAGEDHNISWGSGYRISRDRIDNTLFSSFEPDHRTDETFSIFIQDKINLWNQRVFLTLGSKFEHNDYSGFEYQPNARLSWLVDDAQTVWTSVSRAVRIPSRLDTDLHLVIPLGSANNIPFYLSVDGNRDFEPEKLVAYEAGYRVQASDNLFIDLAVFYNDYDNIQTADDGEPIISLDPLYVMGTKTLNNGIEGVSSGGTLLVNWQPLSNWRLRFQYAYLNVNLDNKRGNLDIDSRTEEDNSPQHQFAIHSYLDLRDSLSLYAGLRYVDRLPNLDNPAYSALDISIQWRPWDPVELALTGTNLTDSGHTEFGIADSFEIERSIYGTITWRF